MTNQWDSNPGHWPALGLGILASIASIVSGCSSAPPTATPELPPAPPPVFLSDEEVTNYAKAILAIEPFRRVAYNKIEQNSSKVPLIICNQPQTIEDLPEYVKEIAVNYCRTSMEIAQRNGFTVTRFNDITANLSADRDLTQLLKDELLRQQRNSFTQ